jgi:tetratricopeptide (TPR) repeat protein
MAKGHITRRDLKRDEIQDAGKSLLGYLDTHRNQILVAALVLVVLILTARVGQAVVAARHEKAGSMLVRAQEQVLAAVASGDPAERRKMLESAADYCDELRRDYPSMRAGTEAFYVKGDSFFHRQEYDQAISSYQNYISRAQSAADKAKGNIAIGYAYENRFFLTPANKDLLKQALDYYGRAQELATAKNGRRTYQAYQAMLAMARLYRVSGETAKAVETYKTIVKERPFYDADEDKPAKKEGSENNPEETKREAQIQEVRKDIHRAEAAHSFEATARAALEELGAATTETPSPRKETGK